jgi:hypothetical protein
MWKVFSDVAILDITHKYVITYSLSHLDCHCSAVITHQNYKAEANHSIKHGIKSGDLQRNQKRIGYQNPWTAD